MDFLPRPDFQCQWHHPNSAIAPISPRSTINSSDEHQNKNFALPLTALFLFRASSVTFYDTNSNTFKILISNTLLYVLVQPEPPLDFNVTWHNYSATFCSFLDQLLSSFYCYIIPHLCHSRFISVSFNQSITVLTVVTTQESLKISLRGWFEVVFYEEGCVAHVVSLQRWTGIWKLTVISGKHGKRASLFQKIFSYVVKKQTRSLSRPPRVVCKIFWFIKLDTLLFGELPAVWSMVFLLKTLRISWFK